MEDLLPLILVQKKIDMKNRILFTFICMLVLGIGYYVQQKDLPHAFRSHRPITPVIPNQQEEDRQETSQAMTSLPVKLEFQQTQVTVDIIPVGLDSAGRMAVKDGLESVSWYQQSAIPGNQGNALFAGHRDWKGELGPFQYLETIRNNEKVLIQYANKEIRTFQVVGKQIYPANEVPASIMNVKEGKRVTLITCTGTFIREKGGYQNRVIVTLELV